MAKNVDVFDMVPEAGIEPARPQWPADFKSAASTNSATRAAMEARTGIEPVYTALQAVV
jgi:hypothetical protein